jgi:hypothetical protein
MKMLIAALALATLIAAPALATVPSDRGAQSQSYSGGGTYKGYPLSDWYRPDSY